MIFSSTVFLFLFLPAVIALYFIPKTGIMTKNAVLLAASIFFYAWGELSYVFVMIASIIINFVIGLLVDKNENKARKIYLIIGIVLNLVILGHFKYTNFLVDSINGLAFVLKLDFFLNLKEPVHLPIGISFFTFQAISYLVDVYRKTAEVRKNPVNLALYISLFPQLIAGPIIRYSTVAQQIRGRKNNSQNVSYGIQRFIIGLGKKVIIANNLGYIVDQVFLYSPGDLSTPAIWLVMILYGLQIFFDFSGYSDMAIGLGRIFGFKFLENFNYPYISRSLRDFWRRWHISLSSWFRDYLYIPLGGNKKGPVRTYVNLFIVFFLCGLWHGASWNFVLWGMFHGLFLAIERIKITRYCVGKMNNLLPGKLFSIMSHAYLLFIITISWVFFRSINLDQSLGLLQFMFIPNEQYTIGLEIFLEYKILLIILPVAILLATPINKLIKRLVNFNPELGEVISLIFLSTTLILSLISIGSSSYNPFIYFQF
jgi:alginate O-acetyltransferase complex protein AlgI